MKSAMHAASQLPGRDPTDVKWMMLLHQHVHLNADDDDNLFFFICSQFNILFDN